MPDRVEVLVVEPLTLILEALTADEDGGPSRQPPHADERFLHLEREVFALAESAGVVRQHGSAGHRHVQKHLEGRHGIE